MKIGAKNGLLALLGVGLILVAIGYYAQDLGYTSGGFIDLKKYFEKENQVPELGVESFKALAGDDATVSFELSLQNADQHNISSVILYYAINPADPDNVTYQNVSMADANGTWKYTLSASFGDAVYYYAVITYDGNATLRVPAQGYNSLLIQDKVAPQISNLSLSYNATTNATTITVQVSDNDAIKEATLYYAIANSSFQAQNLTVANITWANVSIINGTASLTVQPGNYLAFYIEAQDLSGNKATAPVSGYYEVFLNETMTWAPAQEGASG